MLILCPAGSAKPKTHPSFLLLRKAPIPESKKCLHDTILVFLINLVLFQSADLGLAGGHAAAIDLTTSADGSG